ncbi:hypothetical protein F5Y15DRAFT_404358 [Xylariaceae sp. FL0016]|nr:hypothetical protein F5Y15DRAFT_404358 [Xylariaceae sp. FL0016]
MLFPISTRFRQRATFNLNTFTHHKVRVMSGQNPFSRLLSQASIRAQLAVLEPAGEQDAPIRLSLTDASLTDTSYECISYDHANAEDTVTVSVDGAEQDIPKALESALRTFRRREKPRTLWADLLVGRTDQERNTQAAMIRQILENADKTLCWLGPDNENTAKSFDIIHTMANRWSQACLQFDVSQDISISRIPLDKVMAVRAKLMDCPYNDLDSFNFNLWNDIYRVFGSPYWKSVQSISDIVTAKLAIIVCGRSNIRWPNYIMATRAMPIYQGKFFQSVPLLPSVIDGLQLSNSIEIAERRRRLGESVELWPMIQSARDCNAKDVRDYVFSMIPIATPSKRVEFHSMGPQPLPTVDYTKSATQVFTEAARYTILERQDLFIWFAERVPCNKRLKDLPSWAPDFGARPVPDTTSNVNSGMRTWWEAVNPRPPITVTDQNVLRVQAHALDRVTHVSPMFDGGNFSRLCFDEYEKLPAASFETAASRDERFWRSLILDIGPGHGETFHNRLPPSAEIGQAFRSLIAQERVLKLLGCTTMQLQTPEIQAKIRDTPEMQSLFPQCGKSAPYDQLLSTLALGRRFFRTAGGRFGMTAVEDAGCVDARLRDAEPEGGDGKPRKPDLGRMMADPMAAMMMSGFQKFLAAKDPNMARVMEQAVRGDLPGTSSDDQPRPHPGVSEGEVIAALVGGFFPTVLRPRGQDGEEAGGAPSSSLASADSTYEFVGCCYLHGSMNGEDLHVMRGNKVILKIDPKKLVDIRIV